MKKDNYYVIAAYPSGMSHLMGSVKLPFATQEEAVQGGRAYQATKKSEVENNPVKDKRMKAIPTLLVVKVEEVVEA